MRILRVVGSGLLPCGCFVGLYETFHGGTVQIIEERGGTCAEAAHRPGRRLDDPRLEPALVACGRTSADSRSVSSH